MFYVLSFLDSQMRRTRVVLHRLKTQRGVKFGIEGGHIIRCQCRASQTALLPAGEHCLHQQPADSAALPVGGHINFSNVQP